MRIVIAVVAAALAASAAAAGATDTTVTCADAAYAYAGVESSVRAHGIRTVLTPLVEPSVASGHVAAWIGVGGRDAGPNGEPEWIQVGVNAVPGRGLRLYYEWMRPGEPRAYGELGEALPGTSYVLAVVETARDTWQVRVGGRGILPPVRLPGSSRAWHPIATAEVRHDGAPDCNSFAFRFDKLAVASRVGGRWQRFRRGSFLRDPGFAVSQPAATTLIARGHA